MIQQSLTHINILSHYQDTLRRAKSGATVTVPQEHVTLVTRMAHNLFIEKNIKLRLDCFVLCKKPPVTSQGLLTNGTFIVPFMVDAVVQRCYTVDTLTERA